MLYKTILISSMTAAILSKAEPESDYGNFHGFKAPRYVIYFRSLLQISGSVNRKN